MTVQERTHLCLKKIGMDVDKISVKIGELAVAYIIENSINLSNANPRQINFEDITQYVKRKVAEMELDVSLVDLNDVCYHIGVFKDLFISTEVVDSVLKGLDVLDMTPSQCLIACRHLVFRNAFSFESS